ncbi:MAG: amidohydrolase family protein [Planctomycetes bacterium]|nr:amidohydrolase family protein [Planctomycetota bacterium]
MDTRRGFLGSALVSGAAAGFAVPAAGAPDRPGGFVDAHVHVWTPDTARYPLATGFTTADMQPPSFTADELFAACRPHGVDRVVLIQMSFYGFDNSYMLDCIAAHPRALAGVAIIDHSRPDVGATLRDLRARGVRGYRLYADRAKAEGWRDAPGMDRLWAAAADEPVAMCLLADPDALPAIRRQIERFPRTPVVIDHFARIGMRGAVAEADVANLLALAAFPTVHVKVSAFYALGAKRPPYDDLALLVRRLRDAYGAERLMWATDCPYQLADGQGYGPSVALVRDRLDFLSAAERAAMLGGTAARLFFD